MENNKKEAALRRIKEEGAKIEKEFLEYKHDIEDELEQAIHYIERTTEARRAGGTRPPYTLAPLSSALSALAPPSSPLPPS